MTGAISQFKTFDLFDADSRTASANGAGVDLQDTVNVKGRQMKAIVTCGLVSGTSPTLDLKIQSSDDDAATDPYADITGATFTQLTAAGREEIHFVADKRWVRAVATIAGTSPDFTFAVVLVARDTSV